MSGFVHLHLHSEYSLLDGVCRVSEIPKAAKALGQSAVAVTDHGVMYGVVDFYKACVKEGIKPIIGCEVYVAPGSRFDKNPGNGREYNHLVLLVKNETGYKNLINIVSKGFTEGFYGKPRVDAELLRTNSEGLIALSACLSGKIPRLILAGELQKAEKCAVELDGIYGRGNFYLELQEHGIPEQRRVNEALAGISERTGIPLAATNDVHYLKRTDAEVQAVMMCVQMNTSITEGRPLGFEGDEFYLKSEQEMRNLLGRFEGAIENTVRIADMCSFDFNFKKLNLPAFTPPDGSDPKKYLRMKTAEGLKRRVENGDIIFTEKHDEDEYRLRVEYELMIIAQMGYSEYFLIVADFVNYAKGQGIPTGPGRGSGAGSLVAYLLAITEVDPVKYNLLFEMFLNPERITMPDFDIDFCYERRDEVIDYVRKKYGDDHVCQIVTFGTLAAKAAIRDVGRALGMSYSEVDTVAKALPDKFGITLSEAVQDKDFKALCEGSEENKRLIRLAIAVEGMPRHSSTHAAGVVITERPVSEYVPLSKNGDITVTQFDMNTVAELGLLKFDFLALRYLTIIHDTEQSVREREPDFSIDKVPLDDEKTYALISSGLTDGMFQLESAGMRQLLTNLKPACIGDIMTAIALYRPGPMDSIPKYLANRREPGKIIYKSDRMKDILEETYGCIVYQEQVMQIFRYLANYSYAKADVVRKAIAKKKAGVIENELENFVKGAASNGISDADAREIFSDMTGFANYGFKKSHAAAYAIISYRTAYLKAHYPENYYASLITSVLGDTAKMSDYIIQCAKAGIRTMPPDINGSGVEFSVSEGAIRFGLLAIKNVGKNFAERIVAERERGGKYTNFYDFMTRLAGGELNQRQIEALIKSGAFDRLGNPRSQLLAVCERLIEMLRSRDRGSVEGQIDMFGSEQLGFVYPDIPEFTLREKLLLEKESAGMYFSGNMLDEYSKHLDALNVTQISDVIRSAGKPEENGEADEEDRRFKDKQPCRVAGTVTKRVNKLTKNGEQMAFVTIEDRYAEIELIVFPKVLKQYERLLSFDCALCVDGEISFKDDEAPKLIVRALMPLTPNGEYDASRQKEKNAAAGVRGSAVADERPSDKPGELPAVMPRYGVIPSAPTAPPPRYGVIPDEPAVPPRYGVIPDEPSVPPRYGAVPGESERAQNNGLTAQKLYLKVPDMEGELFRRSLALTEIFCGEGVPVIYYRSDSGKYIKTGLSCPPTPFLINEFRELLGENCVILK